jgi:hypothetical protein
MKEFDVAIVNDGKYKFSIIEVPLYYFESSHHRKILFELMSLSLPSPLLLANCQEKRNVRWIGEDDYIVTPEFEEFLEHLPYWNLNWEIMEL